MTLDELIDWVDEAVHRLAARKVAGTRVAHVQRLYAMLDPIGAEWEFRNDWHRLAVKIATLLKESRPPAPDPPAATAPRREPRRLPMPPEKPATRRGRGKAAKRAERDKPARRPRLVRQPANVRIETNPQLEKAFEAVAGGRPIIFVTGGAGTGKSTFIREVRDRFSERSSVVLAPTGVAALNAGGQTIHSFCRLPLRPFMPGDEVAADEPELVRAIDLLIIDEVSMVRADLLDGVDAFLRVNRKSTAPFGGVQMILVGDLFQLPPVVTSRDREVIEQRYPSPFFFSANALKGLRFFPVELEKVYRQRDASFASLLAAIRDGEGAGAAVRQLNEACVGRKLEGHHLILVPTRQAAAAENEARLQSLGGKPRSYAAVMDGTFRDASEDRLPAPPLLVLKPGAQVMFVRNDPERRWVNGTLGVVESLHAGRITVQLDDGDSHDVEPVEWQDVRYALDAQTKKIVEEVAGTYTQFPLIPAWAVTIHKAQGLTLERVSVDLARGAFAEGQVYVALSRCQTIEGLSLRRPVRISEVRCSAVASEFYQRIRGRSRG